MTRIGVQDDRKIPWSGDGAGFARAGLATGFVVTGLAAVAPFGLVGCPQTVQNWVAVATPYAEHPGVTQ